MDVRTINLFQKGIHEVSQIEDGHRVYRMVHRQLGFEGRGRTRQEAYDQLVKKMRPAPKYCRQGEEPPECRAMCTKILTGEILDPDCFR